MDLIADKWKDYEILDAGNGMKLERWKDIILSRPDPQAIWRPVRPEIWSRAAAVYNRSNKGGGAWSYTKELPKSWNVEYDGLRFRVEPTGFKHTGLFPEQAANWDWMRSAIEERLTQTGAIKVLNLFAYTGGATVACAAAGAQVCHVDASKGMVARAKENVKLSRLEDSSVRYIVDDVFKFTAREIRRGSRYDAIIMDPPSYGRGPGGEVWKLEDCIYDFTKECMRLLSDKPLFFLINSYTTGLSSSVTANIIRMCSTCQRGRVEHGDILIPISSAKHTYLPCGSYAAWRDD